MLKGALLGCALLVIAGFKFLGKFISKNPCEGSGNFREPLDYGYEEKNEELEDETVYSLEEELKKLSTKVKNLKRR